jgi:hypothetical protein
MGWYLGELNQPPVIPELFFIFHFFEKMDTSTSVYWRDDYLEGEGSCGHAHYGRGVNPWVPQRPCGSFPRPVVYTLV